MPGLALVGSRALTPLNSQISLLVALRKPHGRPQAIFDLCLGYAATGFKKDHPLLTLSVKPLG